MLRYVKYSTLEYALEYARLGYPVLPLQPGEKRPYGRLVPSGLKNATHDPEALHRWWQAAPGAGVGILPPPEVLVLDFDDPQAWDELRAEHPELAEAPRQRTPRGGVHVFLKLPQGVIGSLSTSARKLPGLDLRGMGKAYLAAAPTELPTGAYSWEVPLLPPAELPLAPEGLLLRLLPEPPPPPPREVGVGASPRRLTALLGAYAEGVRTAQPGTRHNTLIGYARAAGGLVPHGLAPQEAEEALVAAALEAGLPEAEARAAVRWGLEVGRSRPINLGDSYAYQTPTYRGRVYKRLRGWV
ncbi:bifunctional DNA primase/polymerase [Meiothermus hypogaeus]|uniref:DNA primase/polymerase bifunctional N-terminal domain-containing protein n=1 Tax=Meiothermus hypogaeus NBRC 106114 TaxID=1227553 RepID=A0A511R690_9DEIN|nr:bifunctional DNA primase/polymerase [Meiothermus hypogaeus]GEM85124.1 hypothetical protein MHY01S_32900 [Meiothermus hypogaeus NBRC 106114]